jgi:hypothetical protein
MAFNSNFDAELVLDGGVVTVAGSTTPPDGATLVARSVLLRSRDGILAHARDDRLDAAKWVINVTPLAGAAPQSGDDVVAIGTETYLMASTPGFATFNWAQPVTLRE